MKKYFNVFAALFILLSFLSASINAEAAKEYSWYIKRNGNLRPILQKEQEAIYEYNGYYLDKNLSDIDKNKKLYITFDAGYENGNIEKILDILKKENVCSAFFLLDNIILKNTELVTRMENEGHLICNHTKNHKNICSMSKEEIQNNLEELEKIYKECTGKEMRKYFRFPEGKYSLEALKSVSELGYKTIFWSFAYEDWTDTPKLSEKAAIKKILDNTHNGAIILLHPTSRTNALILETVIKEWKRMGYTFGTLDELVKE